MDFLKIVIYKTNIGYDAILVKYNTSWGRAMPSSKFIANSAKLLLKSLSCCLTLKIPGGDLDPQVTI